VVLKAALAADDGSGDLLWNLYARKGEHVSFVTTFPATVFGYDYALTAQTAPEATLVIDANSNPPFEPGTTYHFVVTHANCPSADAVLSTEDLLPPSEPGEGGAPSAPVETPGGSDDIAVGCACRTAAPRERSPLAWAAIALAVVAITRRRRGRVARG
jgi:MYXO-CTERM domain-containing protein